MWGFLPAEALIYQTFSEGTVTGPECFIEFVNVERGSLFD